MSTPTYGRIQVAEPPSNLRLLHFHDGVTKLKTVDHEPKVSVLDQSDLTAQGIYTDVLIPGAKRVDALGACVYNAETAAFSNVLTATAFAALVNSLLPGDRFMPSNLYADTGMLESAAIVLYHRGTTLTGNPASEWPPNDCGSSGVYAVQEAIRLGACKSQRIAHAPQDLCSLLQADGVMQGTPFFYLWEDPDAAGFVDGRGTASDLQAAIGSGLAGGHQTYISAIEKITVLVTGQVDPANTVLRVRNSWGPAWGDHGSFRIHLSTLAMLGSHADYRQLVGSGA